MLSRNCPWGNTDIGLIRQRLKISDLKYTQRAKEDIEQYINRKYQQTVITKINRNSGAKSTITE